MQKEFKIFVPADLARIAPQRGKEMLNTAETCAESNPV